MTGSSEIMGSGKAAISIKEMAAAVGLSRQRFMQLAKAGVFPAPLKDGTTGRPYFTDEMQVACLEVRRRNCGVNGKIVMFYSRGADRAAISRPRSGKQTSPKPRVRQVHADIIAGLHGLGLVMATADHVETAVAELFPQGTAEADAGQVIRAVFLHLRGKNSAEKLGGKE